LAGNPFWAVSGGGLFRIPFHVNHKRKKFGGQPDKEKKAVKPGQRGQFLRLGPGSKKKRISHFRFRRKVLWERDKRSDGALEYPSPGGGVKKKHKVKKRQRVTDRLGEKEEGRGEWGGEDEAAGFEL